MRQLIAMIAAAIRSALRIPVDAIDALLEAFRPKPSTAAADDAIGQVEAAIAHAQKAGRKPEAPIPHRDSDHTFDLEAEVRSALAYVIVNERRIQAGQAPVEAPNLALVDVRLGEWASRLNAAQAQRVLNAMKSRPQEALRAHVDGSAQIAGVPRVMSLAEYSNLSEAEFDKVLTKAAEARLRRDADDTGPAAKMAL